MLTLDLDELAEAVRVKMARGPLLAKDLAAEIGVARSTISRVSHGKYHPSAATFLTIVRWLGEDPYRFTDAPAMNGDELEARIKQSMSALAGLADLEDARADIKARLKDDAEDDTWIALKGVRGFESHPLADELAPGEVSSAEAESWREDGIVRNLDGSRAEPREKP